jgi:hypothetical protein
MKYYFRKIKDFTPNLFACSLRSKLEDRFTRLWEYMLNSNHGIAQSIVDYLLDTDGRGMTSRFVEAIDQSRFSFNHKRRPDLVLDCDNCCIVCEHKITSRQGDGQIPTYLRFLHREKPLYVLYVSNRTDEKISNLIISSGKYIKPLKSNYPYYLWEDFYKIISKYNDNLTNDFIHFMEMLNMNPFSFNGWGNIFVDPEERGKLKYALKPAKYFLSNATGGTAKNDPFGFHVRVYKKMLIQVIRLFIDKTSNYLDTEHSGPRLFLHLKRNVTDASQIENLTLANKDINGSLGIITIKTIKNDKPDSNKLVILREYSVGLDKILNHEMIKTQNNFKSFCRECFEHLKSIDGNIFLSNVINTF